MNYEAICENELIKMGDNKQKLLVLASTFPRTMEDTEPRFVYDLCLYLREWFDITVLVPSFPGAAKHENMNGLEVVRFRYTLNKHETLAYPGAIMSRIYENPLRALLVPSFFLGMLCALKKLCKAEKFDVMHVHWFVPQGILRGILSNKKYPPYLLTGHGGDVCSLNKGAMKKLKQLAVAKASAVTVVSQYLQNVLLSDYTVAAPLTVCPMGCDLKSFNSKNAIAGFYKDNYNIDDMVILFVGRLAEKKGLCYLIEAMKLDPLANLPAHLVIVGDGPLKRDLMNQVQQLDLMNKITFVGSKTHDELVAYYASADIFCAPSIVARDGDQEGWSVVTLEAAASGIPVVTTKRDTDRVIIDNETGIAVEQKSAQELSDAINMLLVSKETRERMGKAGAQYVTQFGWENISRKYAGILLSLVKNRKGDQY